MEGGLNTYGYVYQSPINLFDPFGLGPWDKLYGLPKQFWKWFHKHPDMKDLKGPNGQVPEDIAKGYHKDWEDLGKPGPDNKGKWKNLRGWFIPPSFQLACELDPCNPFCKALGYDCPNFLNISPTSCSANKVMSPTIIMFKP